MTDELKQSLPDQAQLTPEEGREAKVPTVRIQSAQLLPHQSLVVEVCIPGNKELDSLETYLLESAELKSGFQIEPSLLRV